MTKTLETRIEERKKQAEERRIFYKASLVAVTLRSPKIAPFRGEYEQEREHVYNDGTLVIRNYFEEGDIVDGAPDVHIVWVEYRGREVFSEGASGVSSYVPGSWERTLDALYEQALSIARKRDEDIRAESDQVKRNQELENRKKWGL